MKETKKLKKRKFNFLKFIIFCLFIYLLVSLGSYVFKQPIKNIIVLNNEYISDYEIIKAAKIENYPSFIKTLSSSMKKRIEKIPLIKEVKIKKKFGYIIELNVVEYKILYQFRNNNKYVLESGKSLELSNINGVPILINYVTDEVNNKLNKKFALLDKSIISKISEIEYSPTDYDTERFLLYMTDGNEVFITLSKANNLNKYTSISEQLEGHKGILYLDSGNYFEIKD